MTSEEYQAAVDWLFVQAPNYQINGEKAYKPGLDNIKKLCAFFGNPEDSLKMIHVAGTNGKGSTTNMVASVLQQQGYKVGLYNSPHLIEFTERIKVNGKKAEHEFVYQFIQKLKKELPKEIRPSFFEFTTVMAFEYFRQQQVDFAVIEVGLGGRLDSTNIIHPLVTAITNVDLDHMNILGDTVEKIAWEKAGIIKKGIPVVSGAEKPSVREVIEQRAAEIGAQFMDATALSVNLKTDLEGDFQEKNLRVADGIIEELRKLNISISEENERLGLLQVQKNTGLMGRWFKVSEKPLIICDTGHNQAGLEQVFHQLSLYKQKKHIILGFVKDKNIDHVIPFLPKRESFYFVKPPVERGRDPHDYEELMKESGLNYQIFSTVQEGFETAREAASIKDLIFIGGSNFVVGDFLAKNLNEKE